MILSGNIYREDKAKTPIKMYTFINRHTTRTNHTIRGYSMCTQTLITQTVIREAINIDQLVINHLCDQLRIINDNH